MVPVLFLLKCYRVSFESSLYAIQDVLLQSLYLVCYTCWKDILYTHRKLRNTPF